jgi:hypothetical protein
VRFRSLDCHILIESRRVESIDQAVNGLTPAQLRARPAAGMWSILEVVCYLADSEALFADRMKRVLAEDLTVGIWALANCSVFDASSRALIVLVQDEQFIRWGRQINVEHVDEI